MIELHTVRLRAWLLCSVLASCLHALSPSAAHAQELGTRGNLAINVERLFGFYLVSQSVDVGPVDIETDTTDFSLLWNDAPTPLTQPRIGVDYFIDDNFTLGGNLGVYTRSVDAGGPSADDTGILFGIRAGYALRLGHAVSFWPRGGLAYHTVNADGLGADRNLLSLELEGMFSLAPGEGWALLLGPTVNVGLSGESANNDLSENCFGVMLGVVGWLGT
jgi:hypothetical protein